MTDLALNPLEARAVEVGGRLALDVLEARATLAATNVKAFTPGWEALNAPLKAAQDRWGNRPRGRAAAQGDLDTFVNDAPGVMPHGGRITCRRCHGVASLDGHPHGCPRTPLDGHSRVEPVRYCYCGQTMVAAPDVFGPCCDNTPPVPVPGGCRWCGSGLCRVGDPDDLPEHTWYVDARYPAMGDAWVHPRCYDECHLAEAAAKGRLPEVTAQVEARRRQRRLPVGVVE